MPEPPADHCVCQSQFGGISDHFSAETRRIKAVRKHLFAGRVLRLGSKSSEALWEREP
ncbi:hypothetical protein CSE45_2008 [Citreicella sp. SE45]|nr:hypothetical protein CSE45_2008 [Citreicella sp. SE45]